jgi:hypothetical protein
MTSFRLNNLTHDMVYDRSATGGSRQFLAVLTRQGTARTIEWLRLHG